VKAKLRRLAKFLISVLMYYSGMLRLYSLVKRNNRYDWRLKILVYHRVLPAGDQLKAELQPGMCVLQNTFEEQMRFLSKRYKIISVSEMADMISRSDFPRKRTALITFDDGWKDNYDYAFPVLKKYNMPATVFLATDYICSNNLPLVMEINLLIGEADLWPSNAMRIYQDVTCREMPPEIFGENALRANTKAINNPFKFVKAVMELEPELQKKVLDKMRIEAGFSGPQSEKRWMLNWEELRQMQDWNISYGSHGKSHELFTELDERELARELKESKAIIENNLGIEVSSVAYPNGNYNHQVKQAAKKHGYKIGMAVKADKKAEEPLDMHAMKRININEGAALGPRGRFSKAVFACVLEGFF
jgi:peptidoglycan/xylan/chitin deacetylase (PgdA/CDA1 family)